MPFKDDFGILIIVILFLCANIAFLYFYTDVWWDSSVYTGIGKYIYSLGKSGLWEESRPLIWPLILGLGWFIGLDAVFFGRIISLVFAVLILFMIYKIGNKLFSKKAGLLAAFFTAFSYTFLFFSSNILTEIPSTFFVLLAFYFFLENKFFLTGLFSGLAVMTRLFQFFTLIGFALVFLVYFFRKPNFYKKLFYVVIGALLAILPYVLLNYYLYEDILLPFKVQGHLTKTTGWMIYQEHWFYFMGLIKENFFLIFLLTLPLFFKKNYKFYALTLMPLIYLIIFSVIRHKEMRFMLVIMPFLYLLTAYCLLQIYNKIKQKNIALAIFSLMLIAWIIMTFVAFKDIVHYKYQRDDQGLLYFQNYLKIHKGNVWITNPLYALHSDGRIDGLLYFYSSDNLINFIGENKDKVEIVLFNSCDIPCPPSDIDHLCTENRKIFDTTLHNLKKTYEKEINSCKYQIFERAISLH